MDPTILALPLSLQHPSEYSSYYHQSKHSAHESYFINPLFHPSSVFHSGSHSTPYSFSSQFSNQNNLHPQTSHLAAQISPLQTHTRLNSSTLEAANFQTQQQVSRHTRGASTTAARGRGTRGSAKPSTRGRQVATTTSSASTPASSSIAPTHSTPLPARGRGSRAAPSRGRGNARTTRITQPIPTTSSVSSTPSLPPPLINIHERPKRKRQHLQPAERPTPAPRPYEELMKQSEAELAIEARKWSKKAMSNSDRIFFANYFQEQRKMLCIKAIERGVSLPMVDGFLGKRMSLRQLSPWNRFMKTPGARAVFRGPRKGVKHRPAMPGVSAMWQKLSPEEKLRYSNQQPAAMSSQDPNGSQEDVENDGFEDVEDSEDDDMPAELRAGMRRTASLKRSAAQVQNFMDDWSRKFEYSSNILSSCTDDTCATSFLKAAESLDGPKHFPSRMQAYITGYEVSDLAAVAKTTKASAIKSRPVSAIARMSELVVWQASNTVWFCYLERRSMRSGSSNLVEILALLDRLSCISTTRLDLDDKLIDVVYDPTIPENRPPKGHKSRSRQSSSNPSSRHSSSAPSTRGCPGRIDRTCTGGVEGGDHTIDEVHNNSHRSDHLPPPLSFADLDLD
ncbi:uncharacterized protein PGTG_16116 [Puccinia graminis f. sp. tritici CRL 75-36-700-3]|uniref:Uncharacterized protein n=1 Tax=Puccinia graminis f. sp. tritici (strain CRL 75-36-700-3 / race SCCL) TaxID=418459 RepID=E3L1D1_PUCGT|nr:uncharacterized protein PGTG_16116 [Puccinia graminis f. sp. tritici CRL 75-36-700-3]EFP90356.2 hypothetical protein PGTG_16116 [Puccinia graminis f. sp. tritici CRL 75-36-700-3]